MDWYRRHPPSGPPDRADDRPAPAARSVATIDNLIHRNRSFRLLIDKSLKQLPDNALLTTLKSYTDDYLAANHLDEEMAWAAHYKFLDRYTADITRFIATGQYPIEAGDVVNPFTRVEYDLALMLSTICARHRYRIMELLVEHSTPAARGLVVGCGSGLEIALMKDRYRTLTAFDIELNPFCADQHPDVDFREERFTGTAERYDAIYLIELLEHLEDPFALLEMLTANLAPGGRILATTATNIPQFDHRFNFAAVDFGSWAEALGLAVAFAEEIPHGGKHPSLQAANGFFLLTRPMEYA